MISVAENGPQNRLNFGKYKANLSRKMGLDHQTRPTKSK
jgi:hypothetical protein